MRDRLKPELLDDLPPEPNPKGRGASPKIRRVRFFLKANPGKWAQISTQQSPTSAKLLLLHFKGLFPEMEYAVRGRKIFARSLEGASATSRE
jgi:hypothetical protein